MRAHATVTRELEEKLSRDGLPLSWFDVLAALYEAPGYRLRMAELAEQVLLSRSGLTRLVDRLQAEGLVRRERVAGDARGTFTVLTRPGYDAFRRTLPAHRDGIRDHWLLLYTDDELRMLGRLLKRACPPDPAGE